ncbi:MULTISPECIES: MFS transporter [Chromobacterium]|uniref:MFS transporter n=1 Tax=Chromobacterium fluminis TaxID=3044269 RepID=A0ABX0LCD9_9NEIS|nr:MULTISPECIES: MFS transporter [Chromobacterium]NHR05027.1 MFS transporter [Chromobacterium haemolyticum]UJB30598.1 MFS transporter [Chromobacterium sp. Beijing]
MNDSIKRLLLTGGLIVSLAMGIRHGFGFFMPPMTQAFGWSREAFAFALGLQNLVWGLAQPFAGALADRHGSGKVLLGGALLYVAGLALMTVSGTPLLFSLSAGVLLGLALSCVTYSVIFGVVARSVPPAYRSRAMGIVAAAGSFGQFAMIPVEQGLIDGLGWLPALLILAGCAALMLPLSGWLAREDRPAQSAASAHLLRSMADTFAAAWAERGFRLLMAGYFVCGFQVVFIGVHLPAYLRDHGLGGGVASLALALIGLFNIFGTMAFGELGSRWSKPGLLSFIYLARSVVIAVFLLLPLSGVSVAVFAAAMGFLWLSTVPLTNGVIAGMFGVRHLGMLSGAVFFSHQVGSFLGVWLGGALYDLLGNYDLVWMLAIALGLLAAAANLPVRETPSASFAKEDA